MVARALLQWGWRRIVRCSIALFALCLAGASALAAAPLGAEAEAGRAYEEALSALKDGRWVQAELLLERTLMFNPDHAEARLELAGLLALGGRQESARALVDSLIADPRTSDAHRERLRMMLAHPPRAYGGIGLQPDRPVWVAEGFAVWTRNPLARADLSQLTLTFPEGSISLPVDQEVRAGVISGLSVQRLTPNGISVDASVQRLGGSDSGAAHRLSVSGRLPLEGGFSRAPRWLLQTQQALDGNVRHTAALSGADAAWRLSGGLFSEPDLARDGLYLRLEHVHQLRRGLRVSAFGGLEHPMDGVTGYWRAGAALSWEPWSDWSMFAQAILHRDFSGYSPLLEGGARRAMHSLDLALEHSWRPMGAGWQLLARAHVSRRWSNLSLFEYRDAGFQLSIRHRWQ